MHGLETIKALNEACKDSESEAKVVTAILNGRSTDVDTGKGNIVSDDDKPVFLSKAQERRYNFNKPAEYHLTSLFPGCKKH